MLPRTRWKTPKDLRLYVHGDDHEHQDDESFYTIVAVAKFLGWTYRNRGGFIPNTACTTAIRLMSLIDTGHVKVAALKGRTREQANKSPRHTARCWRPTPGGSPRP
jgi:hypothetical protein